MKRYNLISIIAESKSDYMYSVVLVVIYLKYKQIIIYKVHTMYSIHTVQPEDNFLKRYNICFTLIFVLSISHFTNTILFVLVNFCVL